MTKQSARFVLLHHSKCRAIKSMPKIVLIESMKLTKVTNALKCCKEHVDDLEFPRHFHLKPGHMN